MHAKPTFRFAPSPTGYLHIGHALSAVIGYDWARRLGGRFIVRIEDTDVGRARPQFIDAILDDLAWLGLTWEVPVWRQSERLDIYAGHQLRLQRAGLLYPCFATRSEIAQAARSNPSAIDPDGAPLYPGLHKHLDPTEISHRINRGDAYALRLDVDKAIAVASAKPGGLPLTMACFSIDGSTKTVTLDPKRWGDVVIARKDTGTSYHLAGVIDDAEQGVTHVCRGRDLAAASDIHRLLQVLLDLPPPLYHHHDLILDEAGRKLSKSAGDTALSQLRQSGWTSSQVRCRLEPFLAAYRVV